MSKRRSNARLALACGIFGALLSAAIAEPPAVPIYAQNFDKLPEGKPPEEILIVSGEFSVKKIDGNGLLELPGDPLESQGILVGPADKNVYAISARIQAASTGKRFPEFGLGACGPGRYKLWLMPAVGQLQLIKEDEVKAAVPFKWATGTWTRMKLQVSKDADGKFKVEGKAWPDGAEEPKTWMVNLTETESPPAGRACLFATPYAGTPTRFDDILVEPPAK